MREFPKGGLLGKAQHWIRQLTSLQIGVHASSAGFFLSLSIFPALLLLLSLLRHAHLELGSLMAAVEGFLPEALLPYAEELIRGIYYNASAGLVSVSAATALWSASRGIQALLSGLDAVYGTSNRRGYLRARLLSAGYTLGFLAVLLLTLVLHVFGTAILEQLRSQSHPFIRFLASLIDLRFFLLLGLQTALFTAMFRFLPAHRNRAPALPGALLASLGWLVFTNLFSLYVDYFGDHTQVYGSVYIVALGMLWLYLCIYIVFLGGALNRFLQQWNDGDSQVRTAR